MGGCLSRRQGMRGNGASSASLGMTDPNLHSMAVISLQHPKAKKQTKKTMTTPCKIYTPSLPAKGLPHGHREAPLREPPVSRLRHGSFRVQIFV